jgi:chaperonin GroES
MLIVGFKVHLQNYINKINMAKKERLAQPLGDRVLLFEEEKKVETTAGGIILPDSVKSEDVRIVKVVAVGPGIYTQSGTLIPMKVKEGDEVIIPPYHNGTEIKLEGKKYMLVRESELLMVIK